MTIIRSRCHRNCVCRIASAHAPVQCLHLFYDVRIHRVASCACALACIHNLQLSKMRFFHGRMDGLTDEQMNRRLCSRPMPTILCTHFIWKFICDEQHGKSYYLYLHCWVGAGQCDSNSCRRAPNSRFFLSSLSSK